MLKTRFRYIPGLLVVLGAVWGNQTGDASACDARAWVRAPDLAPNTIVHGDARVKISAECPDVDNISLGLRFKERSFMKVLRSQEDQKWLERKPIMIDVLNVSPWAKESLPFANQSARDEIIANKDLWIVKEEERMVFETMLPINVENWNHGVLRNVVQDFSILVSATNFPQALSSPFNLPVFGSEFALAEWIYEYFAQISFANGTTKEVFTGHTDFQPLQDTIQPDLGAVSATVQLKSFDRPRECSAEFLPFANYSIEITAGSGFTFFAGTKSQVVTAVVRRTGPARTFSAPLGISVYATPKMSLKWTAELSIPDLTERPMQFPGTPTVLHGTMGGRNWLHHGRDYMALFVMPNSTLDEIQAHDIVTTQSAPFPISIDVDDLHVITFETYYKTLSNDLEIILEIPRAESELVDPDAPSVQPEVGWGPQLEDDEEEWVPWEKPERGHVLSKSYSGSVPVVVHPKSPPRRCTRANTDGSMQVVPSDETSCDTQLALTHYLAEGARGPIFVDHNAAHELAVEDTMKRELRTPILSPVVASPAEGEEAVYRYYHGRHLYVGETWAKKVAHKGDVSLVM